MEFRGWFRAAAVYNVVWGTIAMVAPLQMFRWMGMPAPNYPSLFQCIGMMVFVYAYGYWLLAVDPKRFAPFIWIGLAGKTFGPIGFVVGFAMGELPWTFGVNCLFNDLIWWPAFWMFALKYARRGPMPSDEPPADRSQPS